MHSSAASMQMHLSAIRWVPVSARNQFWPGRRKSLGLSLVRRGHHPRYLGHAQPELVREAGETSEDRATDLRVRRRAVAGDDQGPDAPGLDERVVVSAPEPTRSPAEFNAGAVMAARRCPAGLSPPRQAHATVPCRTTASTEPGFSLFIAAVVSPRRAHAVAPCGTATTEPGPPLFAHAVVFCAEASVFAGDRATAGVLRGGASAPQGAVHPT